MADPGKHESQDLGDYEVLDGSDTLDGNPGDDPLDRGVAAPNHWSAACATRYKARRTPSPSTSCSPRRSRTTPTTPTRMTRTRTRPTGTSPGASVTTTRPRAGRLVSPDEDGDDVSDTLVDWEKEEVARDTGIDGGAATAEESAMHVIDDEDQ